jgi:iron complex transport system ATP-binding protein
MPEIPVIETIGLSIGYAKSGKTANALNKNMYLQLFAGELTALLGPNGAGKSTLLKTLCGLQRQTGGIIKIENRLLSGYSQSELARKISVVLTDRTNAGGITVRELVSLGRQPYTGFFGRLSAKDRDIVSEAVEAVGIPHKTNSYISELSDGERQKAMIAKALAQQCPIIILDEPTAFLDVTSKIETILLLKKLASEQKKAILLSTHDLDIALQTSDKLWLMKPGSQITAGFPKELVANGSVSAFFSSERVRFDAATGRFGII